MIEEELSEEARRFARRLLSDPVIGRAKLPPELAGALAAGGANPRPARQAAAARLRQQLARERGRARSGHRSYDVNRHIALHQALRRLEDDGTDERED